MMFSMSYESSVQISLKSLSLKATLKTPLIKILVCKE
jgi:hypothetical protein